MWDVDEVLINKKVLIVEDELNNLKIMKDLLEMKGLHVESAVSIASARVKIEELVALDLLLVDLDLPDGIGLSLVEEFKGKFENLLVFVITATATRETITKSISEGVNGVIGKPFTVKQFISDIRAGFMDPC